MSIKFLLYERYVIYVSYGIWVGVKSIGKIGNVQNSSLLMTNSDGNGS
jgi:hypothetical protein